MNASMKRVTEGVGDSMEKDGHLIEEAVRRLIQGTCCLVGEEKECVWDLFHKTREALLDHIEFEAQWIFPRLDDVDLEKHQAEHRALLEKLEEARYEFETSDGNRFRRRFEEFASLFANHHAGSSDRVSGLRIREEEVAADQNLRRIRKRVEHGFVE